jgi:hypothetical protein
MKLLIRNYLQQKEEAPSRNYLHQKEEAPSKLGLGL